jgi:hypothetical protein
MTVETILIVALFLIVLAAGVLLGRASTWRERRERDEMIERIMTESRDRNIERLKQALGPVYDMYIDPQHIDAALLKFEHPLLYEKKELLPLVQLAQEIWRKHRPATGMTPEACATFFYFVRGRDRAEAHLRSLLAADRLEDSLLTYGAADSAEKGITLQDILRVQAVRGN